MAGDDKVLSKEDAAKVKVDLPPAGAAREDELLRRIDALEQRLAEKSEDAGQVPSRFLEPDREIQSAISKNYLDIGSDNPMYKTCWVNYVNINGKQVWDKKVDGWRVATVEDFPEAKDMRREDNTIRVGDTLLMFIRIDDYVRLENKQADRRRKQQFGLDQAVHEIANNNPGVFKVQSGSMDSIEPDLARTMESRATNAAARTVAAKHIGNRMKTGTIPGIPNR